MTRAAKARGTKPKAGPFEKELAGETPPTPETLRELLENSAHFFERSPWELLTEQQLVGVETGNSERCYCSVMGVLGEVISLHAYVGDTGFQFFHKVLAGELRTVGDFHANQHTYYAQFVKPKELTKADKDALLTVGFDCKNLALTPVYRTIRPGYHPWYVTNDEGQTLATCLRAVVFLIDELLPKDGGTLWNEEGRLPVIDCQRTSSEWHYEMRVVDPPRPAVRMPKLPLLDARRLDQIRGLGLPIRGVLEVDHFYGGATIGGRSERKACIRIALAIDSETAFAYRPEIATPEAATGDMLAGVVQNAIEVAGAVPHEVHVREREFKTLLDPLGSALGFTVRINRSLAALDFAKSHLLQAMGDPGVFPSS